MPAAIEHLPPEEDRETGHSPDTTELGDRITELYGYISAGTWRFLDMVRQFDDQGGWQQPGLCSCAHWLNWKCGIGMNAAREKVRVAHAVARLPGISAAFAAGEISYSKVRAMTRVATVDNEDYLLKIARHGTAYHAETLVRKFRRATKLRELETANRQHAERRAAVFHEPDGSVVLTVRLPPEKAALVLSALDLAVERDWRESRTGNDDAERSSIDGSTDGSNDIEPLAARRADAVADIAEHYLASEPAPSSSADRYQVMLHVSAETLAGEDDGLSHLDKAGRVSAETSRRVCCDAAISLLARGMDGDSLDIGRKSRVIPPAIRRALRARDEHCRFPGCTRHRFVDGHHVRHWCDGGGTSLDNLIQLCRHHHRLVHEGGYDCAKNDRAEIELRDPDGTLIPAAGCLPTTEVEVGLPEYLQGRYEDLHIDATTCVSQFDDSRIDWRLAVGHLFH